MSSESFAPRAARHRVRHACTPAPHRADLAGVRRDVDGHRALGEGFDELAAHAQGLRGAAVSLGEHCEAGPRRLAGRREAAPRCLAGRREAAPRCLAGRREAAPRCLGGRRGARRRAGRAEQRFEGGVAHGRRVRVLEHRRLDAAGQHARDRRAARRRVGIGGEHRQLRLGRRDQAQPRRRDDPERPLRADQQPAQVVARDVLAHRPAEAHELATRQHGLHARHPVAGHAVLQRVRPARVACDRPAELRLLRRARVRRKPQPVLARASRDVLQSSGRPRPPSATARRRSSAPPAADPARWRRPSRPARPPRRPARCARPPRPSGRRARSTTPRPPRPPPRSPAARAPAPPRQQRPYHPRRRRSARVRCRRSGRVRPRSAR